LNAPSSHSDLAAALRARAEGLGFGPVGLAKVPGGSRLPLRTAALERWLAAGHQGGMGWMSDPRRQRIEALLPGVRSVQIGRASCRERV